MDSLTHIVIGGLIGEAYAGKAIGRRAMIIGAAAQSLPDIDFIASFWLSPADDLVAHRGITHSILFAVASTLVLAILLEWKHRHLTVPRKTWIIFLAVEIFMHLFLDAFNNYGVGWFEPFTHTRISFNAIFVLDPLFTVWPVIGLVTVILLGKDHRFGKKIVWSALAGSAFYLAMVLILKFSVDRAVTRSLKQQHIADARYFSTPTAFNSFLWFIVAEADSGYYIGYRSVFDRQDTIAFRYYPQQRFLLDPVKEDHEVRQLIRFSEGYYTVEAQGESLVFNDLRFGQIIGWSDPDAKFVFHYYLNKPTENLMVVQRGRFTGWNKKNVASLFQRIKGN
jgi:inner membrane protein